MLKKTLYVFYLIPFLGFLILLFFFWRGLYLDPHRLPSALINKPVPVFVLPTLQHPQLKFTDQDFLGHLSLLNVWATWCVSCRTEHPFLMDIARSKKIRVYGLDYKDNRVAALQLLKILGNPYNKIAFDDTGTVAINWGVYGTPETFVIDQNGIIRYKVIGKLTPQIWQQQILPILNRLG